MANFQSLKPSAQNADIVEMQHILMDKIIGIVIIAAILIVLAIGFSSYNPQVVEGDDTELNPHHCVLPRFCEHDLTQKEYEQRLEMWNAAGCSVRDICTPAKDLCDFSKEACADIIAPQIQK